MEPHIVSLSGGKDSVAVALHLRELGIPHQRVFMDTGWEHPDLYGHLDYLEDQLGPITRLRAQMPSLPESVLAEVQSIEALVGTSPSAFVRWIVHKGMFPSRVRRFCTQELKVRPFLRYVDGLDADVVNVLGIRAQESAARARLPERELMPGAEHVEVWRPIIRWKEKDVVAIHHRHGVRPCPLYLRGSSRVGCWPCIQANKAQLAQLAQDDARVEAITRLEDLVGRMAAERARSRGEASGPSPTMFQSVKRDGNGKRANVSVLQAVQWSQTTHGGRQMMLDGGWGKEAGCVRWGMCESVR